MVPNDLDILSFLLSHTELEGGMTTDQDSRLAVKKGMDREWRAHHRAFARCSESASVETRN